jgi:hypothetical protein
MPYFRWKWDEGIDQTYLLSPSNQRWGGSCHWRYCRVPVLPDGSLRCTNV